MATEETPNMSKFGQMAIIPEPWIMSMIEVNADIIPNKCRKVFLDVLQKGYITDSEKFGEAFNILLIIHRFYLLSSYFHGQSRSIEFAGDL